MRDIGGRAFQIPASVEGSRATVEPVFNAEESLSLIGVASPPGPGPTPS